MKDLDLTKQFLLACISSVAIVWITGQVVWIKEGPWWLEATIVEKPNNSTIIVKGRGSGRLVRTTGRWVKSENPNSWERVA